MNLTQAFRLGKTPCLALVGAGGKTSALFHLARELPPSIIVTASTHLHVDQIKLADSHWTMEKSDDFTGLEKALGGVMLVTGPVTGKRTSGLNENQLLRLREVCSSNHLPLLIEADGSRQKPLKAPSDREPALPEFVETVVLVTGLAGLDKPLTGQYVHRPEIFARLSGLKIGQTITPEALVSVLTHPDGGLKNIPPQARRIVLLNNADTPELQAQAKLIADQLLSIYHGVVAASLNPPLSISDRQSIIHAVYEPVAGIILAGGGSSRFGQPKPLLEWHGKPFVRVVAETALTAGLSPVVVVTGAYAEQVEPALNGLPVMIVRNAGWQKGQSSSIQAGLAEITPPLLSHRDSILVSGKKGNATVGAAIYLLADQPQITPAVLLTLIGEHTHTLAPIVAPIVAGRRANPVLFDQRTFPDLAALKGDVGGRAIFSKYPVDYLSWLDDSILSDVDTPEDYGKLVDGE